MTANKTYERAYRLYQSQKFTAAKRLLQPFVKKHPTHAHAQLVLANMLRNEGYLEAAYKHYQLAVKADAGLGKAYRFIAELTDEPMRWLTPIKQQLQQANTPDNHSTLNFALARLYERLGDYAKASEALIQANTIMRQLIQYDVKHDEQLMQALAAQFTSEYFAYNDSHTQHRQTPIFIIGMPRSGSTLIEQILTTHQNITTVGESSALNDALFSTRISQALAQRDASALTQLSQAELNAVAASYYARLNSKSSYIIDKMPNNFLFLGIIARAFPNAIIIHSQRDKRDVMLSCYKQQFKELIAYAYSLDELSRYYDAYAQLMQHWQQVLPLTIFNLEYEQLVQHPEQQSEQLFQHIGLEWTPACLDFHKQQHTVHTSSAIQVRQPIHQKVMGLWQHYNKLLRLS